MRLTLTHNGMPKILALLGIASLPLLVAGCGIKGDAPSTSSDEDSSCTPSAVSISAGGTLTYAGGPIDFTSSGGSGGVSYSCTAGSIDSAGSFAAPTTYSSETVTVTGSDSCNDSGSSTVYVTGVGQIAAGNTQGTHTCALTTGGNVYCWGNDGYGQLGDNSMTNEELPVEMLDVSGSGDLSNIVSITAGNYHTCALSSAGNVYCVGDDSYGELGDNLNNIGSTNTAEVQDITGSGYLSGIVAISAGYQHTCALSSAGNVYCWGYNVKGQIGNNTTTEQDIPVEVEGVGGTGYLSSIIEIAAGANHTCALSQAGNAYCWGSNSQGELGNNTTTEQNTPVEVLGVGGTGYLSGIASIAAGGGTLIGDTCALSSSGNVYCWGFNNDGQLGNNSTSSSHTPVEVEGVAGTGYLSGITNIALGYYDACAVDSSGSVYCWGYNNSGQLGNNSTTTEKTPVQVQGPGGSGNLSNAVQVSLGEFHSCALSTAGNVYCWGNNSSGQLGNDSTTTEETPAEVVESLSASGYLSNISSMISAYDFSCAINSSKNVYCWGDDSKGELGNGSTSTSSIPVEVLDPSGSSHLSNITALALDESGIHYACALDSSQNVYCWGNNSSGQLGNGTTTNSSTPVQVEGVGGTGNLSGVTSISTYDGTTCAVSGGNVYCWGYNNDGQLGDGTTTSSSTPVEVEGVGGTGYLSSITAVDVSLYDVCALSSGNNVYCWGANAYGQLGNGTTTASATPVEVEGVGGTGYLSSISSISVSDGSYVCAVNSGSNIYCWGNNNFGQLGDGTTTSSSTPTEVEGVGGAGSLSGIASVSAFGSVIFALSSGGNVYGWGLNLNYQLGNGTTTSSSTPVELEGVGGSGYLSGITSISPLCALSSGGNVYCWGQFDVGNGTSSSTTPVEVEGTGGSGVLSSVTGISMGNDGHNCVISGGNVYCWGPNTSDQLGNHSTTTSLIPVEAWSGTIADYLSGI